MADCGLETLSLTEPKKMQKDIAKAISTYEDRQQADTRDSVGAAAREMDYSFAELIGIKSKAIALRGGEVPALWKPGTHLVRPRA